MNDRVKPVYRITTLATEKHPRERLLYLGPQSLVAPELLDVDVLDRGDWPGQVGIIEGPRPGICLKKLFERNDRHLQGAGLLFGKFADPLYGW